jgi:hypothetical protein
MCHPARIRSLTKRFSTLHILSEEVWSSRAKRITGTSQDTTWVRCAASPTHCHYGSDKTNLFEFTYAKYLFLKRQR